MVWKVPTSIFINTFGSLKSWGSSRSILSFEITLVLLMTWGSWKTNIPGKCPKLVTFWHSWDEKKWFFSQEARWNISTNTYSLLNVLIMPVHLPYPNLLGNLFWLLQFSGTMWLDSIKTRISRIIYVEKFQIFVKNLNNLRRFIEIYALFFLNLCGEKMTNMRSGSKMQ